MLTRGTTILNNKSCHYTFRRSLEHILADKSLQGFGANTPMIVLTFLYVQHMDNVHPQAYGDKGDLSPGECLSLLVGVCSYIYTFLYDRKSLGRRMEWRQYCRLNLGII